MQRRFAISLENLTALEFLAPLGTACGVVLGGMGAAKVIAAGDCSLELFSSLQSTTTLTAMTNAQRVELRTLLQSSGNNRYAFVIVDARADSFQFDDLELLARSEVQLVIARLATGDWGKLDLQRKRGALALRRFLYPVITQVRAARRKAVTLLRKCCLRFFGTDLHDAGVGLYRNDGGHCYLAPINLGNGGTSSTAPHGIVLFEEDQPLFPHFAHQVIRDRGQGRYSNWEGTLFFSATDNSDPNSNGRRYRILRRKGVGALVMPLLLLPKAASGRTAATDGEIAQAFATTGTPAITFSGATAARRSHTTIADLIKKRSFTINRDPSDSVVLLITNLGAGGAERQLTTLAVGLQEQGLRVRVISFAAQDPAALHHLPTLTKAGVEVAFLPDLHPKFSAKHLQDSAIREQVMLCRSLPSEFSALATALYTHLQADPPRVLHCWLDSANIVGGTTGIIAGVPEVLLSCRSVNPTHFPGLYQPWYLPWYRSIMECPRVRWITNSAHGAESYRQWIGFDATRVTNIPNGVDLNSFPSVSAEEARAIRQQMGILPHEVVLVGIMRLTQEKRPQRFVRLIHELRSQGKPVRGVLVGGGYLEELVRWEIENLNLTDSLLLMGVKSDIPRFIAAADIVVLTSDVEGFPNVLIEGKIMGKPILSTLVGGAPEIVREGVDGLLAPPERFPELLQKAALLLDDAGVRAKFGAAGRNDALERFSSLRMVRDMLTAYGAERESCSCKEVPSISLASNSA